MRDKENYRSKMQFKKDHLGRGAKLVYRVILEEDTASQFRKKVCFFLKPRSLSWNIFFLNLQTFKNFTFTLKAKIELLSEYSIGSLSDGGVCA